MKNQVKITVGDNGKVIQKSNNNSEWGYIRVEQNKPMINELGIMSIQKLSALIPGKISDLELANYQPNQLLDGKVKVIESLTPFYDKNPEKHLKYINKDSEIFCKKDGQPIYRKTIFTTNISDSDVFIKHTNSEEIKNSLTIDKDEDFNMN